MLKSLDVMIGLAVVMLVVSMGVTLLTQAWISFSQSRGKHLRRGLADLLEYTGLGRAVAEKAAEDLLKHPVVRGSERRMGSVIKREEVVMLLMEMAAKESLQPAVAAAAAGARDTVTVSGVAANASDSVAGMLANLGVPEPEKTLDRIRMAALELERTDPALSNAARHNLAILDAAQSRFVANIHSWFDQTMDRVTERFTFSTRVVTFISAAIVAVALQLDTASLVNRLALDDSVRNALVERAQQFDARTLDTAIPIQQQFENTRRNFRELAAADVIWVPGSAAEWADHWREVNLGGLLVSILLLSLGAPFWYSALNRLLQLRSVLAQKDDKDRHERQTITVTGT